MIPYVESEMLDDIKGRKGPSDAQKELITMWVASKHVTFPVNISILLYCVSEMLFSQYYANFLIVYLMRTCDLKFEGNLKNYRKFTQ